MKWQVSFQGQHCTSGRHRGLFRDLWAKSWAQPPLWVVNWASEDEEQSLKASAGVYRKDIFAPKHTVTVSHHGHAVWLSCSLSKKSNLGFNNLQMIFGLWDTRRIWKLWVSVECETGLPKCADPSHPHPQHKQTQVLLAVNSVSNAAHNLVHHATWVWMNLLKTSLTLEVCKSRLPLFTVLIGQNLYDHCNII